MGPVRSLRLPPQVGQPGTTAAMMADVMIALLPALGMAVFLFGIRVLALTAISIAACVLSETLYCRLSRQPLAIGDLSACVTGMLLAMSLPASAPYWSPALGGAFAILVVKQFYGGMGRNFMNPALGGRMLLATFPMLMTTWPQPLRRLPLWGADAVSAATPMSYLHEGQLPPQSLFQLLLGQQGGCIGEVSSLMLLMGGLYLMLRRVISPRIPLAYLGTAAVLALLFPHGDAGALIWVSAQLLSGGVLMGAFFLATDPVTSPVTPWGQVLFGIGCGGLTMLLRYHSSYPEGVGWAILTMNYCVWLLDRVGMPRRFGTGRFATFQGWLAQARAYLASVRFVRPELHVFRNGKMPGEEHLDQLRTAGKNLAYLGAVILVTGAVISGVSYLTGPEAIRSEEERQQERLLQVMPSAAFRSETPYRASGALSITAGYSSDSVLMGYCVEVQAQGFGGVITLEVGVDLNGQVTGVAVVNHNETANVGVHAMTETALSRYIGRSGTLRTSGDNAVDAVSGATATSRAITAGVNRALAIVANLDTEGVVDYVDGDV